MLRFMLKSKIHRAVVTDANLDYEGSLTLDKDLMELSNIMEFEQVKIYNISNGERFETYILEGRRGSGEVCLNGAAARKGAVGDIIIIASYGLYREEEIQKGKSTIVIMGPKNHVKKVKRVPWENNLKIS